MKTTEVGPVLATLVSLVGAALLAEQAVEVRPYQSLHLEVPYTPSPARVDGEESLVYELHATNFSTRTLIIVAIDVVDAADGTRLARIDPAGAMRKIGADGGGASILEPGERAIVYLTLPWRGRGVRPLSHRIVFDAVLQDAATERAAIAGGCVVPAAPFSAVLGAPLGGGPWTAVSLPEHDNGHRRYPYAVSGRVRLPGRHAIDWMPARGFDPASAGTGVAVDGTGADVLAVADGEIVAVKEEPATGFRPGIEDETGAMVVLRLPDGRFAFYQHLKPEIPVRAGQRVRRGQVIASLGSTGHVTRPHLHFHVADGVAPLDSEGLPYRLGEGRVVGRYASFAAFEKGEAWQAVVEHPPRGIPAANTVVMFERK